MVVQLCKPNPMLIGPSQPFLPRPYKLCKAYFRYLYPKVYCTVYSVNTYGNKISTDQAEISLEAAESAYPYLVSFRIYNWSGNRTK